MPRTLTPIARSDITPVELLRTAKAGLGRYLIPDPKRLVADCLFRSRDDSLHSGRRAAPARRLLGLRAGDHVSDSWACLPRMKSAAFWAWAAAPTTSLLSSRSRFRQAAM